MSSKDNNVPLLNGRGISRCRRIMWKKGERCSVWVSGKLQGGRWMVDAAQMKGGGGVMIGTWDLNRSGPSAGEEKVCLIYTFGRVTESNRMGFVYIRNIKQPGGVTFSVKVWFIFAASFIFAFRRTKKPLLPASLCLFHINQPAVSTQEALLLYCFNKKCGWNYWTWALKPLHDHCVWIILYM